MSMLPSHAAPHTPITRSPVPSAAVPAAFLAVDAQWRVVFMDEAAMTLLAAPAGTVTGELIWQVCPALVGSALETPLRASLADGQSRQFLFTPPGQAQSYEVICSVGTQGLSVSLRAGARQQQQQQQQQSERRLHESETRFQLMTSAIPQIVWITNALGDLEFVNDQWHAHVGDTAAEDSLGSFDALVARHVHPDDRVLTAQA